MNNAILRPYGLQTEQRERPLGIDEPRPRLSWKLAMRPARGRADARTASPRPNGLEDLDEPGRLVWDTGRQSEQTLLVRLGRPGAAVGHPVPLAGRGLGRHRRPRRRLRELVRDRAAPPR